MPILPDFRALGEMPTPQPSGGVSSYSPTDTTGLARGLAGAGADLEGAATLIARSNHRQDVMVAEDAINNLHAQILNLEAGDGGFKNVKGRGVVGAEFLDNYQNKFNDAKEQLESGLQTDGQKQLFRLKAPMVGLQFKAQLLSHQAVQTDKFNEATENAKMDLGRLQMFQNPLDKDAVQGGMQQIQWALYQKAQRLGWDQSVTDEVKSKYTQAVYNDMGSVLVERDPATALALINKRLGVGEAASPTGMAAFDNMTSDKLIELRHRANSFVTQQANQNAAERTRQLKDAEIAYNELEKFTLSGRMVSSDYKNEVDAKVKGTPFEAPAQNLVNASSIGAMHGSLPLDKQELQIRNVDAQFAQKGASPDEAKTIEAMRTITNNQRKAYQENPWAAATQFARLPSVPEQQIVDASQVPKLISQRLPMMSGVETYAGQPISPLQPNEVNAFSDKLSALSTEEKANVLGQTGALLDNKHIDVLADQIDKKDRPMALALRMGADQTTAGRAASTYVLRGAQALADKTVKKDESALAGWRADIASKVRGTLGDDKAEQAVIDSAYYARAALEQEGIAPTGFKPMGASADSAISMVIGLPVERGGVKTFLPRGMKEGDFNDKLGSYTPDKLREQAPDGVMYVRGIPIKVESLSNRLSSAGLKMDGKGGYVPSLNNAPVTIDKQGTQLLRLVIQ